MRPFFTLKSEENPMTFTPAAYFEAVAFFAALFFATVFFVAVDFVAVVFFAAVFLATVFFGAGPFARFSASSSAARAGVISSTESSFRRVALTSPSVT